MRPRLVMKKGGETVPLIPPVRVIKPDTAITMRQMMEGVVLRLMPAPGKKLKPARPETLVKFFGGQGTINVNSWSPDSKKFAYVVYEKL